jgi:molecular chaperone IbpA
MGDNNNVWRFDHTFSDLDKWSKQFIGLDKMVDTINRSAEHINKTWSSYPPFNLKKTEDNKYVLEMAVAGFSKNDIELTIEGEKLLIKGSTTVDTLVADGINQTFLHKGISDRPFTRTFTLADNVEIVSAEMVNGLLKIWLEHIIPDHKKPKKIDIAGAESAPSKQLLTAGEAALKQLLTETKK